MAVVVVVIGAAAAARRFINVLRYGGLFMVFLQLKDPFGTIRKEKGVS